MSSPDGTRPPNPGSGPRSGPRILFFSGGTGLRDTCSHLVRHTHDSIHLVTPFDSGGSSAHLRRAFRMPAVGDLRNRILALADPAHRETRELVELFAGRLPAAGEESELTSHLRGLASGENLRILGLPRPLRDVVTRYLAAFRDRMPEGFDLRRASVGNLFLAGAYLEHGRRLRPAVDLLSLIVRARGIVRPVVEADLHLAAEVADGRTVLGQHLLTGTEAEPLEAPVERLFLSESAREPVPAAAEIGPEVRTLVGTADLVCYPVGSFYSSVLAPLLPSGTGAAVAGRDVPKVFVPNEGTDPEAVGLGLAEAVGRIRERLARDCREAGIEPRGARLLDRVLVDEGRLEREPEELAGLREQGVEVVARRLVTPESRPLLDGERLARALVAMAR